MGFTVFRVSGFVLLLLIISVTINAQVESSPKSKLDSLVGEKIPAGGLKLDLQKEINALSPGIGKKNPADQIKTEANNLAASGLSKVKLLTGGKFFNMENTGFNVSYNYSRDTTGLALGGYRSLQGILDYSIYSKVTVANIPFTADIDANQGLYTSGRPPFNDFYAFNFDPDKYRELLRSQVLSRIKPEQVLSTLMNRIDNIRHSYEQKLLNELSAVQQDFKQQTGELFTIPSEITDLSKADFTSLRASIFKDLPPEKYAGLLKRLQEIKSTSDTPGLSEERKKVEAAIGKYETMEKMFGAFKEKKEQFENNKLVKELKSHLPFTPDKFREYLSKPGNLKDVVRQYGSLSGLQNLFLSLTKLDLGQNPVQSGELNMQGILNAGLNTSFESKKARAGFIVGHNSNVNNWLQGGLNSVVSNEYSGLTGFSIGTGTNSRTEQTVSLNLFNFMNTPGMSDPLSQFQTSYLANAPRQDAVITYHSAFKLGSKHEVQIDLSKSFGSYRNQQNEDSSRFTKSAAGGLLDNEGKANYAAMVNYDGEILNTNVQLMVKKIGLGYSNPGNIFLRRGETQFQLALGRKLLKQKMNLRYKVDYRHQQFDPEKRFIANTFSNKLQMNYRFRKNTRIGISYQRSDYRTTSFYQANGNGLSTTLQADGSYRFSLGRKKISSTSTLSLQEMSLPMSTGTDYRNTTILAVHTSSVPVGKNLLLITLMGNQSKNKEYYFNTAFVNGEAAYVYTLNNNIRLSSGAGYYYNKGWNTQLGVKQSITATLIQRLELDINVDYKKAVRTIRPELANQLLIYSSVRYRF